MLVKSLGNMMVESVLAVEWSHAGFREFLLFGLHFEYF